MEKLILDNRLNGSWLSLFGWFGKLNVGKTVGNQFAVRVKQHFPTFFFWRTHLYIGDGNDPLEFADLIEKEAHIMIGASDINGHGNLGIKIPWDVGKWSEGQEIQTGGSSQ
jgi:hypothetical protein